MPDFSAKTQQGQGSRLGALDSRGQGSELSFADRAYSAIVKKLRWVLPVSAACIVMALMIWPKFQTEISQKRFAPSRIDKVALEKAATENRLSNAKFSSLDAKGRPFSIVSSEAVQETKDPDTIQLSAPSGTLRINETETMTAQAKTGTYRQAKQHLTLNDDVVVSRSDGLTMKTAILYVDLMTSDANTDAPVDISGPQGHLTAQGMTMTGGGLKTLFPGPAKLILNPGNTIDPKGRPKK